MSEEAKWYVIHTYSGYENKVAQNIEKVVENRNLQDLIHEVKIPMEHVTEVKENKTSEVDKKLFPSYVLVKMVLTDDSWYVVRNTRGVTGFVGPGSKPVPLTEEEIINMGFDRKVVEVDFKVGDTIRVKNGMFEGFTGEITEINTDTMKIKAKISMFARDTDAEFDFNQIEHLA